jgi:hypothetical protein
MPSGNWPTCWCASTMAKPDERADPQPHTARMLRAGSRTLRNRMTISRVVDCPAVRSPLPRGDPSTRSPRHRREPGPSSIAAPADNGRTLSHCGNHSSDAPSYTRRRRRTSPEDLGGSLGATSRPKVHSSKFEKQTLPGSPVTESNRRPSPYHHQPTGSPERSKSSELAKR